MLSGHPGQPLAILWRDSHHGQQASKYKIAALCMPVAWVWRGSASVIIRANRKALCAKLAVCSVSSEGRHCLVFGSWASGVGSSRMSCRVVWNHHLWRLSQHSICLFHWRHGLRTSSTFYDGFIYSKDLWGLILYSVVIQSTPLWCNFPLLSRGTSHLDCPS